MLLKPSKVLLAICIMGMIGSAPLIQRAQAQAAAAKKEFKDRAEYDLYEAARTGKDPVANIAKLDDWKKQYPESQYADARLAMYLTNYAAQNKVPDVVNTAKDILKADPNNFTALYYLTLYTAARVPAGASSVPPEILEESEKAANGMMASLDKQKPAAMADAQWDTTKKPIAAIAHTNLGWIAMQRAVIATAAKNPAEAGKQNEQAENEFKQSLALNPANGDVAYWLGIVEANQKKVEKGPELLFYFARAASYEGPGAASAGNKDAAGKYFDKAYVGYHGSKEGAEKVKEAAKTNPAPPADFKIVSVVDLEKDKQAQEQKEAASNPELARWKGIKVALTAADGANYFNTGMKDALLPTLKGKVVKLTPETNPKSVVLACEDGTTGDATLNFEAPLAGKVDIGAELTFEGVPQSYTPEPFMVTFAVEKDKLHGWTGKGPARPAPVHRAPPRKK